jgi:cytochrome c-type protein NapB
MVLSAAATATALGGFVSGLSERPQPSRTWPLFLSRPVVGRVPTYAQERERHHPNRLRHAGNLAAMAAQRPGVLDPVPPMDDAHRADALARRALRRAYDGAPPTVPHPVAQGAFPACLNCHREGLDVAGRVAPAMPHAELGNCLQCHVVTAQPMPGEALAGGPPLDNAFAGLQPPRRGERAWPIAPPTVPHSTLMRGRCETCHGTLSQGIRSTHPWRQSCTQCHAPSAALDQRAVAATESPR